MKRKVYSAEDEAYWVNRIEENRPISLRAFVAANPDAPSFATLSRMVSRILRGEMAGAGRSRGWRLSPLKTAMILINMPRLKPRGKMSYVKFARHLLDEKWDQNSPNPGEIHLAP